MFASALVSTNTATDTGVWPWPDGVKIQIGSGFNTLRWQTAGIGVEESEPKDSDDTGDGQKVRYSCLIVEDERAYREQLSISASASFKGLTGGGSARMQMYHSIKIDTYSLFVLASVSVINKTDGFNKPRLTDVARQEWYDAPEGRKRLNFIRVFGDTFVMSVTQGGEFFALLEIFSDSIEEKESIKLSLEGSMGSWSASANYEKAVEEINKHKVTSIKVIRDGGLGPLPAPNMGEVLAAAQTFPEAVQAHPIPLFFETRQYGTVPDKTTIDVEAVQARRAIEDLASAADDVKSRSAALGLIARDIALFPEVDRDELEYQDEKLERMYIELSRLAEDVARSPFSDYSKLTYPTVALLPAAPRRTPGTPVPITVRALTDQGGGARSDSSGGNGELIGTDGALMAFGIDEGALPDGTWLEYMAHIGGSGDEGNWRNGTLSRDAPHEGIAIWVKGERLKDYTVSYQIKRAGGGSYYGQNGAFAGTRGQYMRIVGIRVTLTTR